MRSQGRLVLLTFLLTFLLTSLAAAPRSRAQAPEADPSEPTSVPSLEVARYDALPTEMAPTETPPTDAVPSGVASSEPEAAGPEVGAATVSSPLPAASASAGDFEVGFTPADGAFVRTHDRSWSLRIGLLWQLRATVSSTPDPTREVEFVPVLSRFYFQGTVVQPWIRYFAQVELAGQQNPYPAAPIAEAPRLLDFYVEAQPHDAIGVRAGLFRPPYTRSWIAGLQRMAMLDRTDANAFFRNHGATIGGSMPGTTPVVPWDRDLGLMVFGTPADGLFEYYAGVFNGNGFLLGRNEADSVMPMVRLAVNPLGRMAYDETPATSNPHQPFRLQVGVSGYYNHYRALYTDAMMTAQSGHEEQFTFGGDVTAAFETVYLSTEVYFRNRMTVDGLRHDEVGAMGIASWMLLPPYLDVAARFSIIDPNLSVSGDLRQVYDAGINVYPAGNNLRLGLRYTASLNDATFLGGAPGAPFMVPPGTLVHSVGLWSQLYF